MRKVHATKRNMKYVLLCGPMSFANDTPSLKLSFHVGALPISTLKRAQESDDEWVGITLKGVVDTIIKEYRDDMWSRETLAKVVDEFRLSADRLDRALNKYPGFTDEL